MRIAVLGLVAASGAVSPDVVLQLECAFGVDVVAQHEGSCPVTLRSAGILVQSLVVTCPREERCPFSEPVADGEQLAEVAPVLLGTIPDHFTSVRESLPE